MNQKRERLYMGIALFALTLTFSMLYLNRYIMDNYSWHEFNALLMQHGKMPYRDFFVYVPPVIIVKMNFLWNFFGGNLIGIVFAGVVERALILTLLYTILSRWFKPLYAFLASMLSFLFLLNSFFDTVGDYNWMRMILILISVYLWQEFLTRREKRPRTALVCLAASYFFVALTLMTTQSTGVIFLLAMLLFFALYSICSRGKRLGWNTLAMGAGLLVGLAPWVLWLVCNDAFVPFLQQVFLEAMNSKGVASSATTGSSVFQMLFSIFQWRYLLIFLAPLAMFALTEYKERIPHAAKIKGGVFAALCVWLAYLIMTDVRKAEHPSLKIVFHPLVLSALAVLLLLCLYYLFSKKRNPVTVAAIIGAELLLGVGVASLASVDVLWKMAFEKAFQLAEEVFSHAALVMIMALCVCTLIKGFLDKAENAERWQRFAFFVGALSLAMSQLVGSGTLSYVTGVTMMTMPYLLCLLLEKSEKLEFKIDVSRVKLHIRHVEKALLPCFCALVFVMSTIIMADKLVYPYSWWGCEAGAITDERSYVVEREMFDGFLVSKETKVRYEEIANLIEKNSDEDDFVLTFPYAVIHKINSGRFEAPTEVPVYFFDVCSDQRARADLEIMKQTPPKIIVWMDVGEECWVVHEMLFRGGQRCGQRDIREWFEAVKETDYELIGEIDNQSVYRLLDGTPIEYTYFADADDFVSDIDEVQDNLYKSNFLKQLTARMTHRSVGEVNALYVVGVVLLLLLVAVMFMSGAVIWQWMLLLFGVLYLILPLKPTLLAFYILPLMVMLSCSDLRDRRTYLWGVPMAILVPMPIVAFLGGWNLFGVYLALPLILALTAAAAFFGVRGVIDNIKAHKRPWPQDFFKLPLIASKQPESEAPALDS